MTNINDEKDVKTFMNVACGIVTKEIDGQTYILLIQRAKDDHWPNHYEMPRGKCDKPLGENLLHCLKREVKEETGLDVEPVVLIDTFEYLADKGTRKNTCYNYLCKIKDPNQKVKLSKEHQSYKWISQLGEAELLVLPDQMRTLEKVLSKSNQISNTPENSFTKNNVVDEYLQLLEQNEK